MYSRPQVLLDQMDQMDQEETPDQQGGQGLQDHKADQVMLAQGDLQEDKDLTGIEVKLETQARMEMMDPGELLVLKVLRDQQETQAKGKGESREKKDKKVQEVPLAQQDNRVQQVLMATKEILATPEGMVSV